MPDVVAKWCNVVGLVLQFVSFWFAAPELIGSERLRSLEGRMRGLVGRLPRLAFALLGLGMGIFGAWFGITASRDPSLLHRLPALVPAYLGAVAAVTVALIVFHRRVTRFLELRVVAPLLHRMIDDEGARARALGVSAGLMTAGFALQLTALLLS